MTILTNIQNNAIIYIVPNASILMLHVPSFGGKQHADCSSHSDLCRPAHLGPHPSDSLGGSQGPEHQPDRADQSQARQAFG